MDIMDDIFKLEAV